MKNKTTRFLVTSVICLSILGILVFWWLGNVMSGKSEETINAVSETFMSEMNRQLQKKFEALIDMQLSQVEGVVMRITEEDFTKREAIREELSLSASPQFQICWALYGGRGRRRCVRRGD